MSRKDARVTAMQLLYQQEQLGEQRSDLMDIAKEVLDLEKLSAKDKKYIDDVIEGTNTHCKELDDIIEKYAVNWSIERLPIVDICILRIAIYEILYRDDIPDEVAAQEAVDIAYKYSTEDSYSYINGIIRKVFDNKAVSDGKTICTKEKDSNAQDETIADNK